MSLDSRVAGLPYESSSFATPASGGTITRAYCRAIYEESVSRCFILPPEQGWQGNTIRKEAKRPENRVTRFPVEKSGEARIGGGERSEPISRMFFMPYDTEGKSVTFLRPL